MTASIDDMYKHLDTHDRHIKIHELMMNAFWQWYRESDRDKAKLDTLWQKYEELRKEEEAVWNQVLEEHRRIYGD